MPLDGTALDGGDAARADGDVAPDAGRRDCDEYARVLCATAERCYLESIWFYGSVERCEAFQRGACEYGRSLEDSGDDATALLECLEAHDDCEFFRDPECPLPAGTRVEGAPCRSTRQCAEGLWCLGTERSAGGGSLACDTGTCRVPLAEGATDCRDREDGNVCGNNLHCVDVEGGSRCAEYEVGVAGGPCGSDNLCAEGLYCSSAYTCEPVLANGAACDPSEPADTHGNGQCGGDLTFECDPETRTCIPFERAFAGDPCVANGSPRCMWDCVEGVCTLPEWYAFGEPCETDWQCEPGACVDGVCGVEPCD